MSWPENISRRRLLNKLAQLIGAASGALLSEQIVLADPRQISENLKGDDRSRESGLKQSYEIAPWTGDDFALGHRLRQKQYPKFPDSVESKVDFVIVGGGVAGLAAAHYLEHEDFLLLEQYDELGGQSRGDSFNGMRFSFGSAVLRDINGQLGNLLSALDLKPSRLDPNSVAWLCDSNWVKGINGGNESRLHDQFKQLIKDSSTIWHHFEAGNIFAPLVDAQMLSLDSKSFSSCLTGYSAPLLPLLDSLCKTQLGAGIDSVSALSGFATVHSIIESGYALVGGNAAFSQSLSRRLLKLGKERIVNKAFVWQIELGDEHSFVTYSGKDGVCRRIQCKHVIVATPHLVSARLFSNLNDAAKIELFGYRYCSYLVATLLSKKKILKDAYAHFVAAPFSFCELATAETPYELSGQYKSSMGSALTIYQPYEPVSNGRGLLLAGDQNIFASSIVEQVKKISDRLDSDLERVVLTRWGHALAVAGPGYFAKLNKLQQRTSPSYSLAHSSAKGLPRVESAVAAAYQAAQKALKRGPQSSKLYSLPGQH